MAGDPTEKSGCLFALLRLLGLRIGAGAGEPQLPYRLRDDFLSHAERSFYGVLVSVVADQAVICPKVRLSDVLYVVNRRDNVGHANRIDRKHVDFLLCRPDTMQPILAVELDDSSHNRPDREERDALVDAAFQAAGLQLIRFTARRQYSQQDVATTIQPHLEVQQPAAIQTGGEAHHGKSPRCPKCDVGMVLRKAKQGASAGEQFYGCPNYPKCRHVVPIGG